MMLRITHCHCLCQFTGLWYYETRYFVNDEEVSEPEFRASFH